MPGPYLALPAGHPIADVRTGILTPPWVIYFQHLTRGIGDSLQGPIDAGDPGAITGLPAAIATAGYWTPITDGVLPIPELLFDAVGDCVVGFVPTPWV